MRLPLERQKVTDLMTSDAEDTKGLSRASSAFKVPHDEHRAKKQKTAALCPHADQGEPWLGGLGTGQAGQAQRSAQGCVFAWAVTKGAPT